MEQSKSLRIKVSMNHGLVIGLILIVFAFLITQVSTGTNSLLQLVHWAAIIGAVYYSIKIWRDSYCDGYISYREALGFGFRTMFFASIIYGFYSMIYMNWINPEVLEEAMSATEEAYYLLGFSDDKIEQSMELVRKMQTPGWQVFTTVVGTTVTGIIISLIVAFFVKKEKDPFQTAMDQIDDNPDQDNS